MTLNRSVYCLNIPVRRKHQSSQMEITKPVLWKSFVVAIEINLIN